MKPKPKRKRVVLGEGYPWLCSESDSAGDFRLYKSPQVDDPTKVELNVPIPSNQKICLIAEILEP